MYCKSLVDSKTEQADHISSVTPYLEVWRCSPRGKLASSCILISLLNPALVSAFKNSSFLYQIFSVQLGFDSMKRVELHMPVLGGSYLVVSLRRTQPCLIKFPKGIQPQLLRVHNGTKPHSFRARTEGWKYTSFGISRVSQRLGGQYSGTHSASRELSSLSSRRLNGNHSETDTISKVGSG